MKLYELADSLKFLLDQADDGELLPDLESRIEATQLAIEDKVDGCCKARQQLLGEAAMIEAEIARLARMRENRIKRAEWLQQYLRRCLDLANIAKIKTALFSVRIQANSRPSFAVALGSAIPEEYRRIKVELDGAAIYEAWKAGKALPPQIEVVQGKHLRIS